MTEPRDHHLEERLQERREIHRGRLITLYQDTILLPSGQTAQREVVTHPGAAAVVAITDADETILVRQWRHAVGRALWEIPAGTLDPGESPRTCAERELREETGFHATRWQELGAWANAPGYGDEIITYFLAEGLTAGQTSPDEDETLDVEVFSRERFVALLPSGETDLKTVGGLAAAGWFRGAGRG